MYTDPSIKKCVRCPILIKRTGFPEFREIHNEAIRSK